MNILSADTFKKSDLKCDQDVDNKEGSYKCSSPITIFGSEDACSPRNAIEK
jgi:hypothetical protein